MGKGKKVDKLVDKDDDMQVVMRSEMFGVPLSKVGTVVCKFPLRWAWVDDVFQPIIWLPGLVRYPNAELATRKEIKALLGEDV